MRKCIKGFFALIIMLFAFNVYAKPANESFSDENLYRCIIDAYNDIKEENKEYSYALLPEELKQITMLDCSKYSGNINNLKGLNTLTSLTSIDLSGNEFNGEPLKLSTNSGKLVSNLNLPLSLSITNKEYAIGNSKVIKIENDTVYPLEAGSTYVIMTGTVSGTEIREKYLVTVSGGTVKKSNNSKLASLFITANNLKKGEGEFSFDSNTRVYTAIVNNSVTKIKINANVLDRKAKFVSGYGPREVNLNSGTNNIEVKVQAEDGSIGTYIISVVRSNGTDANNKLANIELSVGKINFNRDVYNYNFTVATNVDSIDVKGVSESPLSKVTVTDVDLKTTNDKATSKLKIGDNKIIVSVLSESGNKQDYTLNITREDYDSEDNYLSNLVIKGYNINFNKKILRYDLSIKDEKELDITPTTEKNNATFAITGNNNLENNSKISIKVSDENGSTREYSIIVHKQESVTSVVSDFIDFSNIDIKWIVLLFEIVTIIVLLLYIIFRGSNKPKGVKKSKVKMVNQPNPMNNYGNTCSSCGTVNDIKSKTCYVCGNQLR